ncbi:DUF7527 domain-containing protein [Haloplanus aerogenes]|uniref:DUF7527 domain-containing protein n=1 Tax=Haloplanus aerogenes TaxID=660522 RepID=A0A3M0DF92_9EURY|nr:hypothetical protein [Haloplanus aerogenes]AZH24870.1 hypothetical protein DU502_05570 [Haloplanus aerogenes]RMB13923.1 hypothetical protein ATH50_2366 [Haloplanus aerogenes]
MDGEILDAVTEWGTRPVSDGVSGLYELADESFSGAVTDGTAWAFVLNGRFVGIFDGDIDDFEDASLTAHTAPDLSLPLLYAMQARGGEVRGQYYSNDTPLAEIDDTLSSGNFVGYVELSENVLSGDYYVVYYGGRSLPVAFVGNNRRLLSGDEAFERAADEVGIYSVVDADIEVVELPERPDSAPEPDDSDTAVAVASDAGTETDDTSTSEETSTPKSDAANDGVEAAGDGSDTATPDAEFSELDMTGATEQPSSSSDTDVTVDATDEDESSDGASTEPEADSDDVATEDADTDDTSPAAETAGDSETETETATDIDSDELDRLRQELDDVRTAKAELEAERDRIAAERDDYREEVDRLRERVETLEDEIERLEADADATPTSTLDTDEALAGTNLFVRYENKADGTLERAAEGRISEEDLRKNLRLDYHTGFESEGVQVDGRPFESFLRDTTEHQFALWLLTSVTYDIRRTDTRADLSKLYDAIEEVDRIDLDGEIDVTVEDGQGETEATTVTFDVVFRDKMGNPLFAASFDNSRDPTHAETIRSLLDGAQSVSEAVPSFAAAFVVTTSFFDADAMEVAVDATRGGLFSRSSRKSYVKLSRKSGFHLCLVEARDGDFSLTVPDL